MGAIHIRTGFDLTGFNKGYNRIIKGLNDIAANADNAITSLSGVFKKVEDISKESTSAIKKQTKAVKERIEKTQEQIEAEKIAKDLAIQEAAAKRIAIQEIVNQHKAQKKAEAEAAKSAAKEAERLANEERIRLDVERATTAEMERQAAHKAQMLSQGEGAVREPVVLSAPKKAIDSLREVVKEADNAGTAIKNAFDPQKPQFTLDVIKEQIQAVNDLTVKYEKAAAELEKFRSMGIEDIVLESEIENVERLKFELEEASETLAYMGVKAEEVNNVAPKAMEETGKSAKKSSKKVNNLSGSMKEIGKSAKKSSKDVNVLTDSISRTLKRIKQLLVSVMIFNVLRSVFKNIRDYIGLALKDNQAFANSFAQIKGNIATAFQPILDFAIPALTKFMQWLSLATQYLVQFASALTGKSVKAMQDAAKNMDALAKNTKNAGNAAKKALAPFDEINQLTNEIADTDTSTDIAPEYADFSDFDTSGIDNFISHIKNAFASFSSWYQSNIQPVLNSVWEEAKNNAADFKNNLLTVFADTEALGQPLTDWLNNNYTPYIQQVISTTGTVANGLFSSFNMAFSDVWNNVLSPWFSKFVTEGLPKITDFATKMLLDFEGLATKSKEWFDTIWNNSISPLLPRIEELGAKVASSLWNTFEGTYNSVLPVLSDLQDAVFAMGESMISNALPIIVEFSEEVVSTWDVLFAETKDIFDMIWQDAAKPALGFLVKIWDDCWMEIKAFWDKWGAPIFDGIRETIQNVGAFWKNVWETILKPMFDSWMKTATKLWDEHLKPLLANILDFIGTLIDGALKIYNKVILPIISWIVDKIGPVVAWLYDKVIGIIGNMLGHIIDAVNSIINVFKEIINFIVNVFTGNWSAAWDNVKNIFKNLLDALISILKVPMDLILGAFDAVVEGATILWTNIKNVFMKGKAWIYENIISPIGRFFSGLWDGVTEGAAKLWYYIKLGAISMVNFVIEAMNGFIKGILYPFNLVINGLNNVPGVEIPNISFSIPTIPLPKLATGTVVPPNKEFMAILGDNTQEHEVVSPVSKIEEAVENVLNRRGTAGGDVTIVMEIDGRTLGRVVLPWADVEKARQGGRISNRLVTT